MITEEKNMVAAFPDTYMTFELGEGNFGFEAKSLWEISTEASLSSVPRSLPFLAGITHLHGKIVPVLDLCHLLVLPPLKSALARGFIAIQPPGWSTPTGFFVEKVLGFEKFPEVEIKPLSPSDGPSFCKGRVETPGGTVDLIDMGRLLAGLKPNTPGATPPEFSFKGESYV